LVEGTDAAKAALLATTRYSSSTYKSLTDPVEWSLLPNLGSEAADPLPLRRILGASQYPLRTDRRSFRYADRPILLTVSTPAQEMRPPRTWRQCEDGRWATPDDSCPAIGRLKRQYLDGMSSPGVGLQSRVARNGFKSLAPKPAKSATFLVTTVRS
jgi:hypothetical protein